MLVQFKRVWNHDLPLPAYATEDSAGFDLRAASEFSLAPGQMVLVPTGFACAIQKGFEGQIRPRSGLSTKHLVTVINSPGTIDSDYRGEVLVPLVNHSKIPFHVEIGMRIAQMVIAAVEHANIVEVTELTTTKRGSGGFGSTGLN
jgi:dUTP pyrophosphatase